MICAYHGESSDDWRAGLGDSWLSGHSVICEDGHVQSVGSCLGAPIGLEPMLISWVELV